MENARVKVMLQCMQELWRTSTKNKGLELERRLWALTSLECSIFDPISDKDTGEVDVASIMFSLHDDMDILVLDGSTGKRHLHNAKNQTNSHRPIFTA
jgi:hypothetical protein